MEEEIAVDFEADDAEEPVAKLETPQVKSIEVSTSCFKQKQLPVPRLHCVPLYLPFGCLYAQTAHLLLLRCS